MQEAIFDGIGVEILILNVREEDFSRLDLENQTTGTRSFSSSTRTMLIWGVADHPGVVLREE